MTPRVRRWLTLGLAIAALDLSITFENIWPTPAIAWRGGLSIELAIALLALALLARVNTSRRVIVAALTTTWTLLVIGRYAEVTAPALYGRTINLYWDLRFIPDVIAMITRVASWWMIAGAFAIVLVVFTLLCGGLAIAWRRTAAAMDAAAERRAAVGFATAVLLASVAQHAIGSSRPVTTPIAATYARQLRFVIDARSGGAALPATPAMNSNLARVRGADVFVVFLESYGAMAFDRQDVSAALADSRRRFDADIRATHRSVVSGFVESPTFGGSSWLAHLSLLSGIDVRDPDTHARLMATHRDTLVRAFARQGYRTVALMPGMRQAWPEGSFYGFDEIYGADRLAYRGPEFGWFAIPDQFSLDRFQALEDHRHGARQPLFVFFPTISTHFPFRPTPPYQPDWIRMATDRPYDGPDIVRAYGREPDWVDFAPGYVDAIGYDLTTIGGYLQQQQDRDLVMIVLGDHQPAAAVSGEGASWDVPVHIIANRPEVLEAFRTRGFTPGLIPARAPLAAMHQLGPLLLDAFGGHRVAAARNAATHD
jgi:hypothetical protein